MSQESFEPGELGDEGVLMKIESNFLSQVLASPIVVASHQCDWHTGIHNLAKL